MANRIIQCQVTDEFILGAGQVIGAAGSHDDVELELAFSPVWAGTSKTVQWFDALGENPVETMLTTDLLVPGEAETYRVPVPAAPKAIAGDMRLTVRGVNVSGQVETRAVMATTAGFRVLPALWDADAGEGGDVPPSVADQLQAEIEDIKQDIVDAAKAADAMEAAQQSAEEAAGSADRAETAQKAIENMTVSAETRPPGTAAAVYKTMNGGAAHLRFEIPRGDVGPEGQKGEQGIQGKPGEQGPPGINGVAVAADGIYAFNVDERGHLILNYTGDEAPQFSINDTGHLVLEI